MIKPILIALLIVAASPLAMADLFYNCRSPRSSGSELFNPDILSNGNINAVLASDDYEVSERIRYVPDATYSPRTRKEFARYLPVRKGGGQYLYLPVILVEKVLLTGSRPPDSRGNVGTIYAQYVRDGRFREHLYRCQKSTDRNVEN